MNITAIATQVEDEIRTRGIGFSIEGYAYASGRLAELTDLKGLALKDLAGRINANAKGRRR